MNQPNALDDLDAMSSDDEFASDDGFESHDDALDTSPSFDSEAFTDDEFSDQEEGFDMAQEGFDEADAMAAGDAADSGSDGFDSASWQAFEADVADALDSGDGDEFLSRLIGGLSNAARTVSRVSRPVARAAGGASQMGQAAAQLARLLGSTAWARRLGQAGQIAGQVGRVASSVGQAAGQVQSSGNNIAALLGQLMGQGFDDLDAFDQLTDTYEDGVDEALPAIVGLAARGLARGLGHRTVNQLGTAARRALVRGVATAARTLVSRHGPQGARALGRMASRAGGVARRQAQNPRQMVQRIRTGLPRVARRVAQQGNVVRQLATPLRSTGSQPPTARGVRPPLGTAGPGAPRLCPVCARQQTSTRQDRVFRFSGPVDVLIRQR